MMKAKALLSVFSLPIAALAGGNAVVKDRNLVVGAFVDAGQVVSGSILKAGKVVPDPVDNYFLNRNGLFMIYTGTMNDHLQMNIGMGGLMWKPYQNDAESKRIQGGLGMAEASGKYSFSENKSLKFGYFGYKYNPDAVSIGEYLLRSEAYPTLVQTAGPGGWVWLNAAEYKSMGTQFNWNLLGGALRQDFLLFSEFNEAPIYDFSPSYVATLKTGAFEFGAGISFHRWLPIKPSVTTPNKPENTYVEIPNFRPLPAIADSVQYTASPQSAFAGGTLKAMEDELARLFLNSSAEQAVKPFVDSAGKNVLDANGDKIYVLYDLDSLGAPQPYDTVTLSRTKLSFKAVKAMGRISVDLGTLFGMEKSAGPFKFSTEAAILGIENQPYFYEDITQRIPIMFGLTVPTFGLLDLFSVQLEYFKNPWPDDKSLQYNKTLPIPAMPQDRNSNNSRYFYDQQLADGVYKDDDMKWSVYAKKTLFPGLELFLQLANDHFRLQEDRFGKPTSQPLTTEKGDWYYLLRFQWML